VSNAFSLRIFVADGDPDGLRVVERSNWIGKALIFPRALLPKVKQRDELGQTGVYLLLGPRDDCEGEKLYIGEGDPIRPRLESHYAQKDFWTRAVCFVAAPGQLNKAHVQFLEANLVRLAKAAKRMPLDNGNSPAEPTLSEADRADMLVFLANMLGMLPVLGVQAFEQAPPAAAAAPPTAQLQGQGCAGHRLRGQPGLRGESGLSRGGRGGAVDAAACPQHVRSAARADRQRRAGGRRGRLPLFAGLRFHLTIHRSRGGAGAQREWPHRVEGWAGAGH
jgi:hypothetical protein